MIEVTGAGDGLVVRLCGELDGAAVPTLDAAIEACGSVTSTPVTIDLGGLSFLGMAGVRALAALTRRLAVRGRSLTVTNPSPAASRAFEVAALAGCLPDRLPLPVEASADGRPTGG